jgi:hypothetical protein
MITLTKSDTEQVRVQVYKQSGYQVWKQVGIQVGTQVNDNFNII